MFTNIICNSYFTFIVEIKNSVSLTNSNCTKRAFFYVYIHINGGTSTTLYLKQQHYTWNIKFRVQKQSVWEENPFHKLEFKNKWKIYSKQMKFKQEKKITKFPPFKLIHAHVEQFIWHKHTSSLHPSYANESIG